MLSGRRLDDEADDLESIRAYAKQAIEALPPAHRSLAPPLAPYEIKISAKLAQDQQAVGARLSAATKGDG
jgi:hypothetical protein